MSTRKRRKKKKTTEEVEVIETKEEVQKGEPKKVSKKIETEEKKESKKETEKVELPPKKKYTQEEIDAATKYAIKDTLKEFLPYVIIIIVVVIIRSFIVTPVDVSGSSMYPTLKDGDIMLLYKLRLKTVGIQRFDIIVVNVDGDGKLIKRVIGLPGDKIRYEVDDEEGTGTLYVNDEIVEEEFITDDAKSHTCDWGKDNICSKEGITVPDHEYFVMGDNRGGSKDSRLIGTVEKNDILGITSIRVWPFTRFGSVKKNAE